MPARGGIIFEFGAGIAGYAILFNTDNIQDRRCLLNQLPRGDFKKREVEDPENWVPEKGDIVTVPGVGKGTVMEPGAKESITKIGDMVPCRIPNRSMRRVRPRQPTSRSARPRRRQFDYGASGFASL